MQKASIVLNKVILFLFTIFTIAILGIDIFAQGIDYCCKKEFILPNILLLLIGIILVGGIIWKRNCLKLQKTQQQWNKIIIISSVILFLVQVFITYEIIFRTAWDAGIVTAQARLVAQGSNELWNEYFSRCPNNILITYIYSFFYKIAGMVMDDSYGVILIAIAQCFLNTITGFLVYKVAQRLFSGNKFPVCIWIFYVLWIGLSPWFIIPYSDSIGLIIPILLFWIFLSMENEKWISGKCVALGVLGYMGYLIKPTSIIMVIAIVIVEILRVMEKKTAKKMCICGCIVFGSMLVTVLGYKMFNVSGRMGMKIDKEMELSFPHYAMLGLAEDTNGVYSQDDVDFSYSFMTNKERNKANFLEAKERIKNYGVTGLSKHLLKKTLTNFNDGTFTWGWDGEFYAGVIEEPDQIFAPVLRSYYYDEGNANGIFRIVMQFLWILVLMGTVCNGIMLWKKQSVDDKLLILILSLVGLVMFVSIFEARQRYLYVYGPIYILVAFYGYKQLLDLVHVILTEYRNPPSSNAKSIKWG